MVVRTMFAFLANMNFSAASVVCRDQHLFDLVNRHVAAIGTVRVPREETSITQPDDFFAFQTRPNVVVDTAQMLFQLLTGIQKLIVVVFFQSYHFDFARLAISGPMAKIIPPTKEQTDAAHQAAAGEPRPPRHWSSLPSSFASRLGIFTRI